MNSDLKTEKPGYAQTLSVVQYDEKNRPAYAIGIVEDITKSHEMEMALDYARSRDALTGLYTRETGLRMIRQIMDTKPVDQVCALMILDMDDFARINQEEGSVFAVWSCVRWRIFWRRVSGWTILRCASVAMSSCCLSGIATRQGQPLSGG